MHQDLYHDHWETFTGGRYRDPIRTMNVCELLVAVDSWNIVEAHASDQTVHITCLDGHGEYSCWEYRQQTEEP